MTCKFQDYVVGNIYKMQFDALCDGCMADMRHIVNVTYGGHDTHHNTYCDVFFYLDDAKCSQCKADKHRVYVPCDGIFSGGLFTHQEEQVSVEVEDADRLSI